MSRMAYNKGKLYPVVKEDILSEFPDACFDDLEWDTDGKFTRIGDSLFRIEFEVEGGNLAEMKNVSVDDNGVVSFETYHWNGCAHWTELVESELVGYVKKEW